MDAYQRRRYGIAKHPYLTREQNACPDCMAGVQPWSTNEPLTWRCPECKVEWRDDQIVRPRGSAQR